MNHDVRVGCHSLNKSITINQIIKNNRKILKLLHFDKFSLINPYFLSFSKYSKA